MPATKAGARIRSNYAFNPIAEQALRSNQTIVPQRLNAALDVGASFEAVGERLRTVGVKSESPGPRREQEPEFGK